MEICLEINIEKTKYMFVSRYQTGGQNQDIKITNRSFDDVSVKTLGNESNKSKFHSGGK
jgi:hypothetical protein